MAGQESATRGYVLGKHGIDFCAWRAIEMEPTALRTHERQSYQQAYPQTRASLKRRNRSHDLSRMDTAGVGSLVAGEKRKG
jgi:hypothetical protein